MQNEIHITGKNKMMDRTKIRKIGSIALIILGILIFAVYSIHLILFKLSLPPYSIQTEGKYVAFGLEILAYLFSLPVIISLFLLAYLIYPSKFERYRLILKILFTLFIICGFGVTTGLITMAFINSSPSIDNIPVFAFQLVAMTSPFWILGILSIFAFKK